jgi:Ring finger domain
MPTAVQPNNSTTPSTHIVQVTSSIGLLVGVIAIIIFAAWISHQKNPPLTVSPFATNFRQDHERQQKEARAARRHTLESIPIVRYHAKVREVEQDVPGRGNESTELISTREFLENGSQLICDGGMLLKPDSESEESSCPVCTEDFVENERVRVLPCGHIYHQHCIDPWLFGKTGTCPLW